MRAGDQGVMFQVKVTADGGLVALSNYTFTTKDLVFRSPGGTVLTKAATLIGSPTPGANGILQYVSLAADFTEIGNWSVQAHLVASAPSALEWHSSLDTFEVQANL
jgi:hypothetical protein